MELSDLEKKRPNPNYRPTAATDRNIQKLKQFFGQNIGRPSGTRNTR